MRITIPTHIKELLERMIEELYMVRMAQNIKDFEIALDKQEDELFQKDDEYRIKKEIVFYIKNYLEVLPRESYYNVYREVYCDEKIKKLIRKRKFQDQVIKEEVDKFKEFIKNRKNVSWSQDDAYVDSCIFKFVSTEQDFEEVLSSQKCEELTPGCKEKFTRIRIAFLEKTERDIYEERGLLDEVKRFYDEHIQNNNIESDLETFDMWHNIKRTGIYYVFVPVK